MKKYIFFIILFSLFIIPNVGFSANHYIRDGATGSGTSWSDAADDLTSLTLVRGDTYYVADGSYGDWYLTTADSGSTYIYIKKATASAHGTETGWSSSYGDGQATVNSVHFRSSYWIFDGVTGRGSNPADYGFRFVRTSASAATYFIGIPWVGDHRYNTDYITVSHCSFVMPGPTYDYPLIPIYSNAYINDSSYITISYCYFYNGPSNMAFRNWKYSTIEYCYFAGNWSSASNHGQQISPGNGSDDITLRNNIFANSTVFIVGLHRTEGAACNYRWKIYNNVVIGGTLTAGWANADSSRADNIANWQVHNNTHIGVNFGGKGAFFVGSLSNPSTDKSYAYNNLFYNCVGPTFDTSTSGGIIHTNNGFYSCTGTYDSSENGTAVNASGDPFADRAGGNYQLKSGVKAIDYGKALSSPFAVDYNGTVRPQGSGFDIGAYEYAGAVLKSIETAEVPGAPTSFRIE